MFQKVKLHIKQNGLFAFDMNTFNGLQEQWCMTTATHDEHSTVIVETSFNAKRALGSCLITGFLKDGKGYRRFQGEALTNGDTRFIEIEDLLQKAGFSFKKYDASTLSTPKRRSTKLLYICHKKNKKFTQSPG